MRSSSGPSTAIAEQAVNTKKVIDEGWRLAASALSGDAVVSGSHASG
jgi:hypothetical protein